MNSPMQYEEWLKFSGKGLILSCGAEHDLGREAVRATPRSQRLDLVVSPISVPVEERPRPVQRGIRIVEPSKENSRLHHEKLMPVLYSLVGGALTVGLKGKEKVVETAAKSQWRPECSLDGASSGRVGCKWRRIVDL